MILQVSNCKGRPTSSVNCNRLLLKQLTRTTSSNFKTSPFQIQNQNRILEKNREETFQTTNIAQDTSFKTMATGSESYCTMYLFVVSKF